MTRRFAAVLTLLFLTAASAWAGPGNSKPKAPKPVAPVKAAKVTTVNAAKGTAARPPKSPTVKAAKGPAVKASKGTTVKAAKTTTAKNTKATSAKAAKATTKDTRDTTNTPTAPTTETPVTLTKTQEKLQRNTNLAEKLERRLPPGTDLMEAAEGFKNLGQFVAAVNVSNNLGLSFESLKTSMVEDGYSLGQSIQRVKADADGTLEARRAETQAQQMIAESERQVAATSTATSSATAKKASRKPVGGQQ